MDYIISNGVITLTVASKGAEMMSIKKDGTEYLWQGDSKYWASRAVNLFPICGRLTDGKYTYKGNTYEMILHGFAKVSEFEMIEKADSKLVFLLKANEETKKIYPFDFEYFVEYTLSDDTVKVTYTAKNLGDNTMYYAFGGHPGFNVPLDKGAFDDYYLEFKCEKPAKKMVFDACYFSDKVEDFPLENGRILKLTHSLFDDDAVFLKDTCKTVTLKSDLSEKSVTVKYFDMQYLGLWHKPQTDAPYVCIEPWQSVPAYLNVVDDLETKKDMSQLHPGQTDSAEIEITIK